MGSTGYSIVFVVYRGGDQFGVRVFSFTSSLQVVLSTFRSIFRILILSSSAFYYQHSDAPGAGNADLFDAFKLIKE